MFGRIWVDYDVGIFQTNYYLFGFGIVVCVKTLLNSKAIVIMWKIGSGCRTCGTKETNKPTNKHNYDFDPSVAVDSGNRKGILNYSDLPV